MKKNECRSEFKGYNGALQPQGMSRKRNLLTARQRGYIFAARAVRVAGAWTSVCPLGMGVIQ